MSSFKNAIPRRAHKERAQPAWRKKFGLLEKKKDYSKRAEAHHKKEETIQKLKEKAAFRNPLEFYHKMITSKTVDGVHKPVEANSYTNEELMLMKTQDINYIMQKLQTEKKKIEKLTAVLHSLGNQPSNKRVYYAEDREEAEAVKSRVSEHLNMPVPDKLPWSIKRKLASSYKELDARTKRVKTLEKLYMEMSMQQELQKKGRKRKLREDEIVTPTDKPVFKWRRERKR